MSAKLIIPNADFSAYSLGKASIPNDELNLIIGSTSTVGEIVTTVTTRAVNENFVDCKDFAVKVTSKDTTYIHLVNVYNLDGSFVSRSENLSVQSTELAQGYKYRVVFKNGSAGKSDVNLATIKSDIKFQPL